MHLQGFAVACPELVVGGHANACFCPRCVGARHADAMSIAVGCTVHIFASHTRQ
jgi:hypothetical protein